MNPELLFQKNDRVVLVGLQSAHYKTQTATVLGFDTTTHRFITQLDSGRKIKVRGKNLYYTFSTSPEDMELMNQIAHMGMSRDSSTTMKDIFELFDRASLLCPNMYAHAMILGKFLFMRLRHDETDMEKLLFHLKRVLSSGIPEPLKVDIKLQISYCYVYLGNRDEAFRIIEPLLNLHFGRLPQIVSQLNSRFVDTELIANYECISDLVLSGNHSCFLKTDDILAFFTSVIKAIWKTEGDIKLAKTIFKTHCEDDALSKAFILMMEEKYEEAFRTLTNTQEQQCKTRGVDRGNAILIYLRCICLIKFCEKEAAKKFIKKLKRFGKWTTDMIADLEARMKEMKTRRNSSNIKAGTRVRCSNPLCEEVEEKSGEFSVCARCEVTKYCSRKCQTKHWKRGHKNHCVAHKI